MELDRATCGLFIYMYILSTVSEVVDSPHNKKAHGELRVDNLRIECSEGSL